MTHLSPDPDSKVDSGVAPDPRATTGMPRWVKVFGIIALVLVLLVVVMLITGRGRHGPGRHSGGGGSHTPPASHTQLP